VTGVENLGQISDSLSPVKMRGGEGETSESIMRIFIYQANMVDNKQSAVLTKSNNYSTDKTSSSTVAERPRCRVG